MNPELIEVLYAKSCSKRAGKYLCKELGFNKGELWIFLRYENL